MQYIADLIKPLQEDMKTMQTDMKTMQTDIKNLNIKVEAVDNKIDKQTQELKDYIYKNNVDIGVVFTEALEGSQDRVVDELNKSMELRIVRKEN